MAPGGKFILIAECREGIGDTYFEEWMNKYASYEAAAAAIKTSFVLGGHKAYYMRKTMNRVRLSIVSDIDSNTLTKWGINGYKSVADAVESEIGHSITSKTEDATKDNIKIGILRNGLDTLLIKS